MWIVFTQDGVANNKWYKSILLENDSIDSAKDTYKKFLEKHNFPEECTLESARIEVQSSYKKEDKVSNEEILDTLEEDVRE